MSKGAEASLYLAEWFGRQVIVKARIPKRYRIPELDQVLRETRTVREAKTLVLAKRVGVPTPVVYEVDPVKARIVMSHVPGRPMKAVLPSWTPEQARAAFTTLGGYTGRLHANGVIHGDLTTSNVIVDARGHLTIVDFGLSEMSVTDEDRAVEVHLLKRVLTSSHGARWKPCLEAFVAGYSAEMGLERGQVLRRVAEIETRGRYISKEKRRELEYYA